MIIPVHYARDGKTRLRSFIRNLGKEMERYQAMDRDVPEELFNKYRSQYYGVSLDLLNALEEIINTVQETSISSKTVQRSRAVKEAILRTNSQLKGMTPETLLRGMNRVLDSYGAEDAFIDFSQQYYKNSYRNAIGYSSQRDLEGTTLNAMVAAVSKDRPFTFLDVTGRNPTNLKSIETKDIEIETYALNVRETQHLSYKESGYNRIALGTLKGGTFSNEVFDVMFLNPMITLDVMSESLMEKNERKMISETFKMLRPGGVLLLVMPAFRFYKDVCTSLAKGYTDFQVRRAGGFDDSKMLYITAVRRTKEEAKIIDEENFKMLRNLVSATDLQDVYDQPYEPIQLPQDALAVPVFRGSVLNKDEVSMIFENSSCMSQFFRAQQYRDVTQETREPLLPFTTGQLGLVLTSGSLDGIIDEGDGHSHVVKGRVVKAKTVERNEDSENNEVTYTETIANRVEINVITADGTLKQLA